MHDQIRVIPLGTLLFKDTKTEHRPPHVKHGPVAYSII